LCAEVLCRGAALSAGGDPAGFGAAATGIGLRSFLFSLFELLGFWEGGGEETGEYNAGATVLSSARVKPLVEGVLTVSNVRVEVSNAGDVAALVVEVVCARVADTGDAAAVVSGLAVLESASVLKPLRVASLFGV
jgi:hypothetical protein